MQPLAKHLCTLSILIGVASLVVNAQGASESLPQTSDLPCQNVQVISLEPHTNAIQISASFDQLGSYYLATLLTGAQPEQKLALEKHDLTGALLWSRDYPIAWTNASIPSTRISVSSGGGAYVALSAGSEQEIVAIGPGGDLRWDLRYSLRHSAQDGGDRVYEDSAGNIYLNEAVLTDDPTRIRAAVLNVPLSKFDADGNLLWTTQPTSGAFNFESEVNFNRDGKVVLLFQDKLNQALELRSLSPNGQPLGLVRGPGSRWTSFQMEPAPGGVYLLGFTSTFDPPIRTWDVSRIEFDSTVAPPGGRLWFTNVLGYTEIPAPAFRSDEAYNLYAVGSEPSLPQPNVLLLKMSPEGQRLWALTNVLGTNAAGGGQFALDLIESGAARKILVRYRDSGGVVTNGFTMTLFENTTPGLPTVSWLPEGTSLERKATVGQDYTLRTQVTGRPAPELQWFHNGTPLPGKTNTFLNFSSVSLTNAGTYALRATSAAGCATSDNLVLVVSDLEPTRIFIRPALGTPQPGGWTSWTAPLEIRGRPSCGLQMQISRNMATWFPLAASFCIPASGVYNFTVTMPSDNAPVFYRVVLQ